MYAFRAFVSLILFAALGVRSNPVESVVVPHEFCESADLLIVTAVRPSHKCGPAPLVVTNPGRVLQITAAINASWCMTHYDETYYQNTYQLELRSASESLRLLVCTFLNFG